MMCFVVFYFGSTEKWLGGKGSPEMRSRKPDKVTGKTPQETSKTHP